VSFAGKAVQSVVVPRRILLVEGHGPTPEFVMLEKFILLSSTNMLFAKLFLN
jgi:hypothetical protein